MKDEPKTVNTNLVSSQDLHQIEEESKQQELPKQEQVFSIAKRVWSRLTNLPDAAHPPLGFVPGRGFMESDLDLLTTKKTSERFIDRLINVRKIVSHPKRSIPFEPIVLTPEEVEERLAIGDQFIKGIVTRGKVLYVADLEVNYG